MKLILTSLIALIIGLGIGLLIGENHSSKQLAECNKQNGLLFKTLVTEAQRGAALDEKIRGCGEKR